MRLFMVIAEVCFNAIFGAIFWGNGAIILYRKQNNTWVLENMKFISSVEQNISRVSEAIFSIYYIKYSVL